MLIDQIKQDRLAAMKARDEVKKNLLGTLVAAATKDAKLPDDASVLKTIRSFLKSIDETAILLEERGLEAAPQHVERTVLAGYLPQPLSDDELRASIAKIVAGLPEPSVRAMSKVMAALRARHGDALDSRTAVGLVRSALS